MYVPTYNAMPDLAETQAFVLAQRVGQLVTVGRDGAPDATLLPVLWEGDRVIAHLARNNPHWERITAGTQGLVVVSGPDAYISPSWYASKREHGRVVPTWNYSAVHLSGPVRVVDDPAWVLEAVTRLTERHEGGRRDPWQVTDAPTRFVASRLRAIVGVELTVTSVEGKAKLSQNRSDADRRGAIEGLRTEANHAGEPTVRERADREVADRMGDALEADDRR
ncbi:FMN-binding negative transcriptional regulator [Lapillicoccus sp.]|uniref:FMN-binding negative transcriptional regulator n=1 Tax=Lapillicoccus sp. TaxID=1909287 RepID=UPI0039832315